MFIFLNIIKTIDIVKKLKIIADGNEKEFTISIIREPPVLGREKKYLKYLNFPYKIFNKGNYEIIDSSNFNDFINSKISKKENPILIFSPYCVKFYKLTPDIFIKPDKPGNSSGYFVEPFKFIIFFKELSDFWVPNSIDFGDIYKDYKELEIKEENISVASLRITDIFNDIRGKTIYFASYRKFSNYKEIKSMDKSELNKYGYYFDFIYWLVSDELSLEDKYDQLKILFQLMGEFYYKIFSELLIDVSDKIKNNEKKKKRESKKKYF